MNLGGMVKIKLTGLIFIAGFLLIVRGDALKVTAQTAVQGREFHETYDLAPNGTINVTNTNGTIRVTGWNENQVKVDAIKRGRRPEEFALVEIQVNARPERIDIRTVYPRGRSTEVSVDYDLKVPRSSGLITLNATNGEITVTGPLARVSARSTNGSVTAQDVTEMANLASTNGSVRATRIGGELRVSSTNGEINVNDVASRLIAQSTNGPIRVIQVRDDATANSTNGSVRLERIGGRAIARSQNSSVLVNDAGGDVQAESINDNVTITNVRGRVVANAVSGNIIVGKVEEGVRAIGISGSVQISDAKGRIEVSTVSDSINLNNVESRGVTASSVSGSVRFTGKLSTDGVYNFNSHSSDVILLLPADSSFRLTARSISGSINIEFPCQLSSGIALKDIQCTVSKGGADVRATSFSGSVNIRKSK